jgi:RND family efflux transporter MFP subunit
MVDSMKFDHKKIFMLIFALMILVVLTSCGESDGSEKEKAEEDESRVVRVETEELKGSQYTDFIKIIGQLKPIEKASLSHPTGGIIKTFNKDKGDYVNKGDTIAVIDNDVLKANLASAKAKYDLAEITYDKQEEIFKQKVNSEIQVLEAKANRDAAKANFELIKAQLEDSYITAAFPGIVDAKYYEEGELAGPGMPIVNLINISRIKVEAGLPERYVGQVSKGAPVKILVKNLTDKMIEGRVSFIGNSVTTNNRTFPIEIMVSTSTTKLKPELVAELFIENEHYDDVITIPQEVAERVDDGYEVFIVDSGKAVSRNIKILNRFDDKIAVKSGLKKGEQLIVVGYQNLVHGQKVKIVN